ncbi:MAG: CoA-binding protein [Desulfococcaceae bacterium]
MSEGKILTSVDEIAKRLAPVRTIAVLGLSPKPERDSFRVAQYMKEQGYRIIPVRPAQSEILGETAYASLTEIPDPVDVVDIFRNPKQVPGHVAEILAMKHRPGLVWMQLGISHEGAAKELIGAGIDVIMDRCIKVDHAKYVARTRLL